MKQLSMSPNVLSEKKTDNIPTTARGRAIFTIDCFLNGKPVLNHHDNPALKLANIKK